jgi:nitroreductase
MDILKTIKERRSVRKFKKEEVPSDVIDKILEAGRWAPSGLNNQPWRFMVLDKEKKDGLAEYTEYSHIIKSADKVILVFFDKEASYNQEKDLLAIGACIENMLLCISSLGYGACWLGEILNQRKGIYKFLDISQELELEAVIALGKPLSLPKEGKRKQLKDLIV